MHRRQFIRNTGLAAGAMTIASRGFSAIQQPGFTMKPLRADVGYFTERGGTIAYYKSPAGWVVVDSEFADPANHLITELKKNPNPFALLINTHHHKDHTSGNIAFKGLVQHVVGHENCLSNYQRVSAADHSEAQQLFQDVTFKDTWTQRFGGESIKAYYYGPGHTNGDAIIHFEHANIVHMGDLMFNSLHPFVDRSAGASITNWMKILPRVRDQFSQDTIFIFGHANNPDRVVGTREELKTFENYLHTVMDFVAAQIKAGRTRAELVATTAIPGVTFTADGAARPLGAAYDEQMAMANM